MPQALIGRTTACQQLSDGLAAASNQKPGTVLIDGDPGVGKTSLTDWFGEEAAKHKALVLNGSCIELGAGAAIPYGALTEALRLFVRRMGPERAQSMAGRTWPTLGALISDFTGVPAPASVQDPQPRIFGAVLRLADHIGRRGPLVLMFEDVHWADPSTLDLIRYVTKAKTDQKLMLVCSFRPVAAQHPLQALLGEPDFQRRVHRITLTPFTEAELDAFVTERAGRSIPDTRLRRYFELSEGNAYFAEQLVAADDPRNPNVEVPRSLRELMMARLSQLGEEATEVMRIAAVAGRRLSDSLLAAVSELDERSLERALLECVGQRILVRDGTDDAYIFEHALLRDTAYGEILPRTRKRIHARIAEAISAEPGANGRLMPELAFHWFEAGRLPEAFTAGVQAGGLAAGMRAFPEAEAQYERALRLWPDVGDPHTLAGGSRESVLGLAADAARWAGHVPQALDWVRQAIAEVNTAKEPGRAGELQERLGSYLWEAGQREESAAAYAQAERLLSGLPPSAVASRVQASLATSAIRGGDYLAGLLQARRAVRLARAVGARPEEGRALNSMGLALAFAGQIDEGESALRAAVAIATEVDHLEDLFRAYGNLGVCLEHGGRLADAVAAMNEGLARAKEHGLLGTRQSGVLANNAAAALSLLGRYREAAALLDSVLLERPPAESLYARLTRAEICVAQGNFAAAASLLAGIQAKPSPDPRFIGPLHGCLAEAAAWQGRLDEAREVVVRGLAAIAGSQSERVVIHLCAIGLRVAADLGDTDSAAWVQELADAVSSVAGDPPGMDEVGLLTRLCHAERARAGGEDTAEMWAEIVHGWAALDQPHRKAYAQGRQAGAAVRAGARQQAGALVREAHATAEEIGAEPLRGQIEALAHSLRLRLGKPRPHNLTPTELKVLHQLGAGRTNSEIAGILFISPSTVGVHVGSILQKMGVRNRSEAADLARREGITG